MIRFLTLILAMVTVSGADAQDTHPSTLAALSGATMVDSGVIVITSTPEFAREESFEYVRRPDGGITLLNTITATDGRFRTRARFDMDADWNALSASGLGLYEGVPVEIFMQRNGAQVDIQVHGEGVHLNPTAVCDPDCFINMSPTTLPMFVMTRHYDRATGGVQTFRWTGQDLDRVRTLSGGKANLDFAGEIEVSRAALPGQDPEQVTVLHFTFVEEIPLPDGKYFRLNFDLWTDAEHRPLGFRAMTPGTTGGTVGFRKGWDDVRAQVAG